MKNTLKEHANNTFQAIKFLKHRKLQTAALSTPPKVDFLLDEFKFVHQSDVIYFNDDFAGQIVQARILQINAGRYLRVAHLAIVDADGRHIRDYHGMSTVCWNEAYPDAAECSAAREKKRKESVYRYIRSIRNLSDLVDFPFTHSINEADDYVDREAAVAYRIRARELMGQKTF